MWLKNPSSFGAKKKGRNCGWEIPILLEAKKKDKIVRWWLKKPNSFGGKKGRNYGWKIPNLFWGQKKEKIVGWWLKKPNSFGGEKGRNYGWKIPILFGGKNKRGKLQVMRMQLVFGVKNYTPLIHSLTHSLTHSTTWLATTCSWKGVAKLPYPKKSATK